jgi:ABC-type sugar transport system substrate-binding protein
MKKFAPRGLLLVLLGVAAFLALAVGCGDDNEEKASPTPVEASPTAAASASPSPSAQLPELPKKTIGHLQINGADVITIEMEKEAKAAVEAAGWEWVTVDAGGDPTKMAQGMLQLANMDVDAILNLAVEPAVIQEGLELAKSKNIPVIAYGGNVTPSPLIWGQYAPAESTLGSFVDTYMIDYLGAQGKVFVISSNIANAYQVRLGLLKLELELTAPELEIVGEHEWDFANPYADAVTATSQAIQQYPDLDAVWGVSAALVAPMAEAIEAAGKTDQIKVFAFYGVPSNLDLMRQGKVQALADFSWVQTSWMPVDALVQYFGADQPISTMSKWDAPVQYALINPANVPPSGVYEYPIDYSEYIVNKWKSQFSNIPGLGS